MSRPSADEHWWDRYLPSALAQYFPLRTTIPGDVYAVAAYLLLANLILYVVPENAIVVRSLIGFPLLFFIPGYVLVAVLFPGQEMPAESSRFHGTVSRLRRSDTHGIDWRERLALSFGTSVALLPLLGLTMSGIGVGYSTVTIVGTLSLVSALGLVPAVIYRTREPPADRFQIPVDGWKSVVRDGLSRQTNLDAALNVVITVLVVASLAGVGYAIVDPNNAESFTSVSVLTSNGQGELVSSGYPETIDGSGTQLTLQLENNEGTMTDYTVVAELQQVQTAGASTDVVQRQEVDRMSTQVAPGRTWTRQHTVQPEIAGEDLRLIYYVYKGDAPSKPSIETAYRHVDIWVDVPSQAVH